MQKAHHRHRGLLRARNERPRGRRATYYTEKIPTFHTRPQLRIVTAQTSTLIGLNQQRPGSASAADVRFGSKADICSANGMSALPPKADIRRLGSDVRFVPVADMAQLFDHLVGAGEHGRRHGRSIDLAVLMLITNSYFVGACTGRSAGFSPLRIRST